MYSALQTHSRAVCCTVRLSILNVGINHIGDPLGHYTTESAFNQLGGDDDENLPGCVMDGSKRSSFELSA
jgi:hypothetical protein